MMVWVCPVIWEMGQWAIWIGFWGGPGAKPGLSPTCRVRVRAPAYPAATAPASAGYGIVPAHPPLPTAKNLPFHPDAGSQISVLMSESLLGVNVAVTRQKAGRLPNGFAAAPPRPAPPPPGGTKAPAATI